MATKNKPIDPIRLIYSERTNIDNEKSKSQIKRILLTSGATDLSWLSNDKATAILFTLQGRRIRFRFDNPQLEDYGLTIDGNPRTMVQKHNAHEQAMRQIWRSAMQMLKHKVEIVKTGLCDVDTEFFCYIVLPDSSAVGDHVLPVIDGIYKPEEIKRVLGEF